MEVVALVVIPAITALVVAALVDDWYDRYRQEGQALALSYIQHLQAARRLAIKAASAGSVDWMQSQKLFAVASQLQDLIADTQQDYVEDVGPIRKVEGKW